MIFLLKSGKVKSLDPTMSEPKFIKKYEKDKEKIAAILMENDSRLRSDTYILLTPEHFRHTFKPFELIYACSYMGSDEPFTEDNVMTREVTVSTFHDMYGLASSLLSMARCYEMSGILGFMRFPMLISVGIKQDGKFVDKWDENGIASLVEFFERNDIWLETDKFMDASVPKNERVEAGHYHVRYITTSEGKMPSYYLYERKAYLYMRDDCWGLDVMTPVFFQEDDSRSSVPPYGDGEDDDTKQKMLDGTYPILVGTCITGTGMLYCCHIDLAGAIAQLAAVDITVHCKTNDDTGFVYTLAGANALDALYLALFIPQALDIGKFLYEENPVDLSIELLFNRFQMKCGVYEFDKWDPKTGIAIDLFYLMAKTIVEEPLRTLTDA